MKTIYLDNNATTAVAPEVLAAMLPYLGELYGNPSSMHSFGGQVGEAVDTARERIAALLGAGPDEIIFTSCGSESDNTAIWSALQTQPEKRHLITTRVEHPAVLNVVQYWERQGYHVTLLGVDGKGRLDLDEYAAALSDDTALVSIMFANNEVGDIYPIQAMAEMAKERGILFHTDAVQAVGKTPIDLRHLPVDMLSLSGHKIHAPKGIGVLYVRKGVRFRPFLRGGHQERGRRGGHGKRALHCGPGHGGPTLQRPYAGRARQCGPAAGQAGKRPAGAHPRLHGQRRCGKPPAQHQQYRLQKCGRRGYPADARPSGHLRQLRFGLHLGQPGAVACAQSHGRALQLRPRFGASLPLPLHHGRGCGLRD